MLIATIIGVCLVILWLAARSVTSHQEVASPTERPNLFRRRKPKVYCPRGCQAYLSEGRVIIALNERNKRRKLKAAHHTARPVEGTRDGSFIWLNDSYYYSRFKNIILS